MRKNTMLYVVSTPNENHFFFTSKEAREDYNWGKSTMKKLGDKGEIAVFKMKPLLDEEGEINDYESDLDRYFKDNLDEKICEKILSEDI